MKVSLNWIKEHVKVELEADELCDMLTMAGLEVESVERVGHGLDGVIAGRILEVFPHPNAQRLQICRVSAGEREYRVVCGAPNLNAGQIAPIAIPGARLPNGMEVKEVVIRGETSVGMLLAEDEMALSDDHSGLMILPPGIKEGTLVASAMSLEDWVLDIGLTPNRSDCASVIGIAREIAALTGGKLMTPELSYVEEGPPTGDLSSVIIHDPSGCRRYAAGVVSGVRPGPSPFWMRYRLYLSGIRSINSVVDVTNYVMLETGQPLHAFDYDRLGENRIQVRRAEDGENFTTLDGKTHQLSSENLMICDGLRSVALAGVMGGLNSEISPDTKNILLESAYFDPVTIRRGAKALGVSTEASYRFERGIDLENVVKALKRALGLIRELAGGKVAAGIIDNYPRPYIPSALKLRVPKTNRYLGTDLSSDEMAGILKSLEMKVEKTDGDELSVIPPSFRVDITREVDLTEEIARIHGYGNIPVSTPAIRAGEAVEEPVMRLKERMSAMMVAMGYSEIITYSFTSPQYPEHVKAGDSSELRAFVRIKNPLSVEQSVMRTSLVAGLLGTVQSNCFHGEKDLRLFEIGKVFIAAPEGPLPHERFHFCAALAGSYQKKTWFSEEREADFFDVKGTVESLLQGLGVHQMSFTGNASDPAYDPEVSAGFTVGKSAVGRIGKVSKTLAKAYDIEGLPLYLIEMDLGALAGVVKKGTGFNPPPRFPAVLRDISIIVDKGVYSGKIADIIREEGGYLVESVALFDLYEGKQMNAGEKALAYRICYRSKETTLEGGKVNLIYDATIRRIVLETGGRLREA